MTDATEAEGAIEALNGSEIEGRTIKVEASASKGRGGRSNNNRKRGDRSDPRTPSTEGGRWSTPSSIQAKVAAPPMTERRCVHLPIRDLLDVDRGRWLVIDGYEDEPAAFGVPPSSDSMSGTSAGSSQSMVVT